MAEPIRDLDDDPQALHALAHPLRVRLLDTLRGEGPLTASDLARLLGESSGSTSYHLRQLARHGFIEEDTDRSTGRQRYWRHAAGRIRLAGPAASGPNAGVERRLVEHLLARDAELVHQYLERQGSAPEWSEAALFISATMRLDPAGLDELGLRLRAVLDEAQDAAASNEAPGALPVTVLLQGVPWIADRSHDPQE
jgi:DNA-binding transcriptional ArsR family regulator